MPAKWLLMATKRLRELLCKRLCTLRRHGLHNLQLMGLLVAEFIID